MVLDSSAIVAIFRREPPRERLLQLIDEADARRISAVSLLECAMVLESRGGESLGLEIDLFLSRAEIEVMPADEEQAQIARRAWRRFGKGRHPAGLNFGDCFAYALAKSLDEELLAVGGDFGQTDTKLARL